MALYMPSVFPFCLLHKKKYKNKNYCTLSVLRHAEHPTAEEGPQSLTASPARQPLPRLGQRRPVAEHQARS